MKKIMIVTGGGRGIGAATARFAARHNYAVAVNYRSDKASADQVVAHIERHGGTALAIQADVSVEADIVRLFETVDKELGPVTVLVNNAGIGAQPAFVAEMDAARVTHMMAVNVVGPFICAREAIARMANDQRDQHNGRGHGGAIVNVSSAAARASGNGGAGTYVDYAASKGAIDTFTEGLSKEVASQGIRVNAVRPGVIDTGIHAANGMPDKPAKARSKIPMGRIGTADEVAHAILYLAEAGFTTGAFLDVDGGV